jgi:hypothetical protein
MLGAGRLSLIASDVSIYDPYWSSVALLMAFENNLTDDSTKNQTVTASGFAPLYGTGPLAKFDTYAVILNAGANYLNVITTSGFYFGTGDFTIETWMLGNGGSWGTGNVCVMDIAQKNNGVNGGPSGMFINTSSVVNVKSYNVAYYDNTALGFVINPTAVASTSWNHICIGRRGGVVYIGANGVLSTPGSSTKNWFPYDIKIHQDFFNENNYTANFDEFRVTSGVWRYGSGSTYPVPTARFPRQ